MTDQTRLIAELEKGVAFFGVGTWPGKLFADTIAALASPSLAEPTVERGSKHHELKCVQPYFDEVQSLQKLFEIRLNDRDYRTGDMVTLREFINGEFTERAVTAIIGFVTDFQQRPGHVVFSLQHPALYAHPPALADDACKAQKVEQSEAAIDYSETPVEFAPPHSLPKWPECNLRVQNADFFAKRVAEGGYGAEDGIDTDHATELHRFIYEYDDADPLKSSWFMHRLEKLVFELRAGKVLVDAPAASVGQEPIPMVLFCPECRHQHVDAPEPEKGWTNPPHKSHLCHKCGTIWRPADVATNGVESTKTHGSADSILFSPQAQPGCVMVTEIEWPKDTAARRRDDMSATGVLMLCLDADNDVGVAISKGTSAEDAEYASVEFCSAGSGGGKSSHTRKALIALMVAMEKDDAEAPQFRSSPTSVVSNTCKCGMSHRKHCGQRFNNALNTLGDWCGNKGKGALSDCGHSHACHAAQSTKGAT